MCLVSYRHYVEGKIKNKGKIDEQKRQRWVTIEVRRTLNHCKGTIVSEPNTNSSIEKLKPQNFYNVKRTKTGRNGELFESNRNIITFDKPHLLLIVRK